MGYIRDDHVSALLSKTKAGEESAFFEIAEQYKPLIDSCVCYFSGKFPQDELEQEALIALYRAACTYDSSISKVSFGLYAKICINNSLISLLRSIKKGDMSIEDVTLESDDLSSNDPSIDYINKESFSKLDKIVKSLLSDYEYAVFRLYIEGYRVKEISIKLNKTEKSVAGAIMRLRIKLRSGLQSLDL